MDKHKILDLFKEYVSQYDIDKISSIWDRQSKRFKEFWKERVLNDKIDEIEDFEIDEIVRFFDGHAKGNTRENESVGAVMIAQGLWRRMINSIHKDKKLRERLTQIFESNNNSEKIKLVNDLYKINEDGRNGLTGQSGNAINTMLFVWNPSAYTCIVSLKHRKKIIEFLGLSGVDFDNDTIGEKIIKSGDIILKGLEEIGIKSIPRLMTKFFYYQPMKDLWNSDEQVIESTEYQVEVSLSKNIDNPSLFYMESQLEDFLIENWDKTELGQKYDLIVEDGEMVSQQYRTDIGIIDILVEDKKTKDYVVIELKKNQTSDDTVGQVARYMGWIKEHKAGSREVKSIIIASKYDQRLDYALRMISNVEVYLYRVNFNLEEFRK